MAHDMFERYNNNESDSPKRYFCVAHRNEDLDEFYASQYNPRHRYFITKGESKEIKIDVSNLPEISDVEFKFRDRTTTYEPEYTCDLIEDPCYTYISLKIPASETLKLTETDLIQDSLEFEMDVLTMDHEMLVIKLSPIEVLASMCDGIILEVAELGDDTYCGNGYVCGGEDK